LRILEANGTRVSDAMGFEYLRAWIKSQEHEKPRVSDQRRVESECKQQAMGQLGDRLRNAAGAKDVSERPE
jgi:hypothetical protein